MKHTFKVTIALVLFFLLAQIAGLLVVNKYIDHRKTAETKIIEWQPLPYNLERPEVQNESYSFIYITIAILVGTLIVFLLMKYRKPFIWKFWFFATVWLTLSISLAAFINRYAAAAISFIMSVLKSYRPNIIVQNISEIFIYGGLAAIFVPMINIFAAFMLLIVISIYDFIAVFKTKHMVKLATFQSESKVFAGLFIPYGKKSQNKNKPLTQETGKSASKSKKSIAVLGGGDIGFTLIFAGVVMKGLMLQEAEMIGFLKSLIIPLCATAALSFLLIRGKQNKFYPAMPFLSAGCFIGYLIVLLV